MCFPLLGKKGCTVLILVMHAHFQISICTMKMLLIYGDSVEDGDEDDGSLQVDDEFGDLCHWG